MSSKVVKGFAGPEANDSRSDIKGVKSADADNPDSPFAGRGGDSTDRIVQRAMHDAPNRVELLGWTRAPLAVALLFLRVVAGSRIGVRTGATCHFFPNSRSVTTCWVIVSVLFVSQ
jgi:hypothetical protein